MTNEESAIDDLADDSIKLAADFGHFAVSTADQLVAAAGDFIDCTIDTINNKILETPNQAIDTFLEEIGLNSLNNLIDAARNASMLLSQIQSASTSAQGPLGAFSQRLKDFSNNVNQTYPTPPLPPSADSANSELATIASYLNLLNNIATISTPPLNNFLNTDLVTAAHEANSRVNDAREKVNQSLSDVINQVSFLIFS